MKRLKIHLRRLMRSEPTTHNNTNQGSSSAIHNIEQARNNPSSDGVDAIYQPLNPSLREIRLLKAHNKENLLDESIPLVLSLHTKSLLNYDSFIALSYTWGDPQLSEPITCNGQTLLITKNLEQALRTVFSFVRQRTRTELSEAGSDIYLWADAICINQSDIKEKAEQIPLMRDIYTSAVGAFAHVGVPRTTDPSAAFAFLESLGERAKERNDDSWDMSHPDILAYCELWTQPWFNRSWVFQEMVLSKNMICLYGKGNNHSSWLLESLANVTTGYRNFENAHKQLTVPRHLGSVIQSSEDRVIKSRYLQNELKTTAILNPVDILSDGRASCVGDLRDKVWSLLGILDTSQMTAPLSPPDYSTQTSIAAVYAAFGIHCIQNGYGIDLLIHSGTSQIVPNLPTWAPDWSCELRHPLYYRLYAFTKSTVPSIKILNSAKIIVRGAIFDEIAILARPCGNIGELLIPELPHVKNSTTFDAAIEQK